MLFSSLSCSQIPKNRRPSSASTMLPHTAGLHSTFFVFPGALATPSIVATAGASCKRCRQEHAAASRTSRKQHDRGSWPRPPLPCGTSTRPELGKATVLLAQKNHMELDSARATKRLPSDSSSSSGGDSIRRHRLQERRAVQMPVSRMPKVVVQQRQQQQQQTSEQGRKPTSNVPGDGKDGRVSTTPTKRVVAVKLGLEIGEDRALRGAHHVKRIFKAPSSRRRDAHVPRGDGPVAQKEAAGAGQITRKFVRSRRQRDRRRRERAVRAAKKALVRKVCDCSVRS